jgi:hypothetical protein
LQVVALAEASKAPRSFIRSLPMLIAVRHTLISLSVRHNWLLSVKRVPPFNNTNPTSSTWHRQRREITISLTVNLVIARLF